MAYARSAEPVPLGHEPDRDPIQSERLRRAFRDEESAAVTLATRAQLVALVVTAIWLFISVAPPRVYFLEMMLGLFAVTAILQWSLLRREGGRIWRSYLFVAIYMGLLTFSMVGYDLLIGDRLPPQVMLRHGTFVYFFLFLALVALTYSPRLVLWAGLIGTISWSTGVALIIAQPGTLTPLEFPLALT
jgi:adenylate cyclase